MWGRSRLWYQSVKDCQAWRYEESLFRSGGSGPEALLLICYINSSSLDSINGFKPLQYHAQPVTSSSTLDVSIVQYRVSLVAPGLFSHIAVALLYWFDGGVFATTAYDLGDARR